MERVGKGDPNQKFFQRARPEWADHKWVKSNLGAASRSLTKGLRHEKSAGWRNRDSGGWLHVTDVCKHMPIAGARR